MVITELTVQGVRGFSPSAEVALRPGHNVLKPPAAETPSLGGLIAALCFSDGRGTDASFLAPGQRSGKVGLTFLGNDQVTYRLVRTLGGGGVLERVGAGASSTVSEEATEIGQFLRAQVGLPPRAALLGLFIFAPSQLPSRGAIAKPAGPTRAAASSSPPIDVAATQERLTELVKEYQQSKEVDELQRRVDAVTGDLFELEGQLKGADGLRAAIVEAERAAAGAPSIEQLELPADIVSRAERFPQLLARRDEALAKIDAEREAIPAAPAPSAVEPIFRNPQFLAGVGGGLAFLLLGLFLHGYPRYVALFDIPAFGYAALLALKYVEELQGTTRVSRKGDYLAIREKRVRDEFEAEGGQVKGALQKARVESVSELVELLARGAQYLDKVRSLKDQLLALEQDPAYAAAFEKAKVLKAEQETLNAQLAEKGTFVRELREVEREIGRARETLSRAKSPVAAPLVEDSAVAGPTLVDPCPAVLKLAADLFAADLSSTCALLKDRCGQYLAALTDKRCTALEWDFEGRAALVVAGKRMPAGGLPGRDLDLLYLALRLTVIERYSARFKAPVVIEDFFAAVDPAKLALLGKMLRSLGALTQLLHVTGAPAWTAMADATGTL